MSFSISRLSRPRTHASRSITHSTHSVIPTTSPGRLTGSSRGQGTGRTPDSPYVVLQDVPRSSLATDILRRLKDTAAVAADFPLANITLPPPSFPRRGFLTNPVHLTCENPKAAQALAANLTARRLYPRVSLDVRSIAQLTRQSAREWIKSYLDSVPSSDMDGSVEVAAGKEGKLTAVRRDDVVDQDEQNLLNSGYQSKRETKFRPPSKMDTKWAMRSDLQGKRVVISGLPGKMSGASVDGMVKEYEVDADEGIMRLKPSQGATTSIWCITLSSTAEAYRLCRELHNTYFEPDRYGTRFRLIAEVS